MPAYMFKCNVKWINYLSKTAEATLLKMTLLMCGQADNLDKCIKLSNVSQVNVPRFVPCIFDKII